MAKLVFFTLLKGKIANPLKYLLFIHRDALIPFATDNTIGSYVGLTTIGSSGGIAYQVSNSLISSIVPKV
jgi:hypothetical protein